MYMKISIITVVFNRVETIQDAISSLQSQTYGAIEHVIQDGGSVDGTIEKISHLVTPTTRFISEPDKGIYDAINKGIARATGEVIGLMHSDDFFAHQGVLDRIAEVFQDPDVDGVYGDLDYVSASDPNKVIRHWRAGHFAPELMKTGWMPPHPTLFLRSEVFKKWGVYNTQFQIAADYDAILRYLWTGKVRVTYIPEVLVKMRVGGESNRTFGRIVRKSREDLLAIRNNGVGGISTLLRKNIRKLPQFFLRE